MAKVVSTEKVTCHVLTGDGEGHEAVLVVFDDGTVQVRCAGGCGEQCVYGLQVTYIRA